MKDESKGQIVVFWVLWAALQSGVFVLYFVLGGTVPQASATDSSLWQVALGPVFISTILRWYILPRARSFQVALPSFIAGLALAESACIMGLFVFPEHKQELFILGVLGMLQFIPFYARSIVMGEDV